MMNLELALLIGQLLLKYGPDVAAGVTAIFKKQNPTLEDWDAVFAKAQKSYDSYTAPKT